MAEILGLKEFQRAIKRNPAVVIREGKNAVTRGIAKANKLLVRTPWKVGDRAGKGRGVPTDTGNLRQTHVRKIQGLVGRLYPTAPYAKYVHGRTFGESNQRTGVTSRPWLNRIAIDIEPDLKKIGKDLLKTVSKDLAK